MTQEEKELLLKDLCGRLPYGVKCQIDYDNEEDTDLGIERYCDDRIVSVCIETEEIGLYEASEYFYPNEIKPYLRPMSSMTEEEETLFRCELPAIAKTDAQLVVMRMELFLKGHLDFNHLIEKGLAIEAPEGMYKNE